MHLQLSRNFTLEEFTYSRIAIEQGLENIPNPQALGIEKPYELSVATAPGALWQNHRHHQRLPQRGCQSTCRRREKFATYERRSCRLLYHRRTGGFIGNLASIRTGFRPGNRLPAEKVPASFLSRRFQPATATLQVRQYVKSRY